ncbi:PilN domain-containing protein [Oceanicoccus sagamiensis]|uniref:Fimbrial assembly protein n=1 Tax=Oceanicoccus sagamiensis TaxID=716816 RepID=A0A1X9NF71_9GAMM|nr:PilN domain-containing protein [Oceanicoccus sagamiensis]ARN73597.1 hypothetical protein BST96_05360 [Oceanicoccus sagamiensis]
MQHLNLYSELDRAVEPPFSGRQQLWIVAAVVVVMVLVYGVLLVGSQSLQSERDALAQRQLTISDQLEQLKERQAKLERDNNLDAEIALLLNDIDFRRQLLASIDPNTNQVENGFAGHLEGLARQHIDGMWLTEIQLQQGGQDLALIGRTRAPEFVPRYLQNLATESIFSGRQFKVFKMSIPEGETNILDFELRGQETISTPESKPIR